MLDVRQRAFSVPGLTCSAELEVQSQAEEAEDP